MAIPIAVLGCGQIGRAFLRELDRISADFALVSVLDSTGGVVREAGLSRDEAQRLIRQKEYGLELAGGEGLPLGEALLRLAELFSKSKGIVVDVSSSRSTADTLLAAVRSGWGAVLANKLPLVGPWPRFQELVGSGRVRYEATVGAGIPVLALLQTLKATGDEVLSVRGVVSGTLGFILQLLEENVPFSQAVSEAVSRGYTEPHPAEDLSGRDVARKALIIARTLGHPWELADVELAPLCPPEWGQLAVGEFLQRLRSCDARFQRRLSEARRRGRTLRYVLEVSAEGMRAGLEEVGWESPLARVHGVENVFVLTSKRLGEEPLVLAGPGAGAASTVFGLLSDLVRLRAGLERGAG